MDTIYIASPNSLHFSQAKQAILQENRIVEKPFFSTPKEMDEIIHLANEHNVYFLKQQEISMNQVLKKDCRLLTIKRRDNRCKFQLYEIFFAL